MTRAFQSRSRARSTPCGPRIGPSRSGDSGSRSTNSLMGDASQPGLQRMAPIVSLSGTVNLIGSGRDKAHEGRSHEGLCLSGHAGDLGPGLEGLGSGGSVLGGGAVIAAEVEEVGNLIVSGEEALSLAG